MIKKYSTNFKYYKDANIENLKNNLQYEYGLRDLGDDFFNPVQQSVKGVYAFQKLVEFKKVAILMNENYYKTRNVK